MTRRISTLPGAADLLFPGAWGGNHKRNTRPEPDDWRPERRHRIAGWSARRRNRYPFGGTPD